MNWDDYPVVVYDQPIMSTLKDKQGEVREKGFLEEFIGKMPPKFPVGQDHDMKKPIVGYFENFRLVPP